MKAILRTAALVLLTPVVSTWFGTPRMAVAQEPPALERVEDLVRAGRTEEARQGLLLWWNGVFASADRRERQRALWLRGRLTVDPVQADLDFRRLVIEFPGGMFSDRALLRLAQSARASGDAERAQGFLDQLARDYPASPVRREADQWVAHAGDAMVLATTGQPDSAVRMPTDTTSSATASSVERSGPPGPPAPVLADTSTVTVEVGPAPPSSTGRYSIQLGAFASEQRARAQLERVKTEGYEGRLVRIDGSRLIRVRVGRFDDSADADNLLRDVQRHGFVAVVVRDARKEERVRKP